MTSSDSRVTSAPGERGEPAVEEAFDRLVSEGSDRLDRPLLALVATGFLGGVDIGVGVLAYLVVDDRTGQPLLGAAAFTIGFIALLLARSELFTENFLVPVTARVAGRGTWFRLLRLWGGTLGGHLGREPGRRPADGRDDRGRVAGTTPSRGQPRPSLCDAGCLVALTATGDSG